MQELWIILPLATLLAAFIGTTTGFGLSTILIPLALFWMPLPAALLFVALLHLFSDFWKMALFKRKIEMRLILTFGLTGIAGSVIGASLSFEFPEMLLKQGLGIFLIAYTLILLFDSEWKMPRTLEMEMGGGFFTGLLTGLLGIGGVIRSSVLSAYRLPKESFIFMNGLLAAFVDLSRIGTYWFGGTRLDSFLWVSLLACLPMVVIGALLSKKIVQEISEKNFRTFVAVALLIFGFKFLLFP